MKKIIPLSIILMMAGNLLAQQQNFDIISYTPPKGWKKESSASALQFSKEASNGGYCIITVFKSLDAPATPRENFDATWETVVKEMVTVTGKPEMQAPAKEDGWEALTGHAAFEAEGQKGVALLVTSTGYGKMVNMLVLTNTDAYEADLSAFMGSVNLNKPSGSGNLGSKTASGSGNNTTGNNKPVNTGYAFNSTNFDDGWVSTVQQDWVKVSKGDINVYLWYALPYNGSDFSGTGLVERDYYWDNHVSKYFTIQTKQYQDNGEYIGSFKPKYVEGWATDKQTGQRVFIAMTVSIAPNTAYITIAAAPGEASIRRQFPKANDKYTSDLTAMSSYNKFAVGKNDLIGKWSNSSGGTLSWYSTVTGQNVGATGVAKSDVFQFNSNNSYTSIHNGATGRVGAMNTFQQKYNGAYTVSNWVVTATKRWDGKTEQFSAWFEAGKGKRALHLDTPGITYTLFKE